MTMSTEAPAGATGDELVASARELFEPLRALAAEADEQRHLPQGAVDLFSRGGFVRTHVPKRFGGYELDLTTSFDIGIEFGRAFGSAGWVFSYWMDHAHLVALFPDGAQQEVWRDGPDARVATSFAPTGTVTVVDGGYVINGEYAWGSGVGHSQWTILGGLIFPEGADHPDFKLFLVPVAELEVVDTWHSAGLRGTGSDTVVLDDIFVPEHRSVLMEAMREGHSPGAEVNPAWMYRIPLIAHASRALLGPATGVVRGLSEAWQDQARTRAYTYTREEVAASLPAQILVAESSAQIDAAELLCRRALAAVEQEPVSLEQRVINRRDWTYAMRQLVAAADKLMQAAGAHGILDASPIQRAWRDVHAISSHVTMNFEAAAENYGRIALGHPINPRDPLF